MIKTKKRTGLLILGMHRSGTSALTRVLSLLGYALPRNVTGGSKGNETGHWESALIAEANNNVFNELGLTWFSWSPMTFEQLSAKKKRYIVEDFEDRLQAEFSSNSDFVLKDPRLCRTAPLVIKAFENKHILPKIIIPVRNPLEVAQSLQARDDISKEQSALIWLRYTLDAELASRGHARVFTFFDELLSSPQETLKHIFKTLKIKPPTPLAEVTKEIDRFLNGKMKHHLFYRDDVMLDNAMRGWVSRTFFALVKLRDNPNSETPLIELDAIRQEVNDITPLFETILNTTFNDQQKKINAKAEQVLQSQNSTVELTHALEAQNKQLEVQNEQLNGELSQLSGTLIQRNQELREKSETFNNTKKNNEKNAREKAILQTEVNKLHSRLLSLQTSISNHETKMQNYLADINAEKEKSAVLLTNLNKAQQTHEQQRYLTEQAILDYEARNTEVQHLRELLAKEQRTVIKPAVRRLRSVGGTALRTLLPATFVERLAFAVPTAEQKLILKTRSHENITANITFETHKNEYSDNTQTKPDIFIFAIIGWHFRTQRPQHIARELSKRGHRVFYFEMDPPSADTEIEQLGNRLYRIKLKLNGAPNIPAYSGRPTAAQEKAWLKAFYKFCDDFTATPYKHLIIQHPFWWQLAKLLPPEYHTLYDCMDDIAGFANSDQALIKLEHELLENCDDLVVSATTLMNKYKKYNPLQIIRNATELEHFLTPNHSKLTHQFTAKKLIKDNKKIIKVGYVGAIADWFHTDLLRETARARPDIEFHFCGNVSADHPHTLNKEPNIHMYGEIPYDQVPAFLDQMDVVTIPFKILPIIQACDPVKFYEYSALGKPTVTTPLPELSRVDHLAFFAKNSHEFIDQIDQAFKMRNDVDFVQELQNFAKENTWTHRAEKFSKILDTHPKVSIIILAYGDPELTNAALSSLKTDGDIYPNMEIIIVDNGSSTENITSMRNFSAKFDDVRIIENGENLGFAAGNNVGLEAATGDYVLLLNNDTFVSPGSIQAMMLHLKNNPNIGAVGPLTNNIGNEAKLPINYASMEEMATKSRALKTGFRGKNFETRVVAYFAVMFRQRDLESFGHLSIDYGRGMFEDDDHCNVINSKGFTCVVAEDSFVHHHLSATFSKIGDAERQKLFDENKATFEKKWGPWQAHKYRKKRLNSDLQFPNEELF